MLTNSFPALPFDTELKVVLDLVSQSIPATLTLADLPALRGPGFTPLLPELLAGRAITHEERTISGPLGAPDLIVSIFRPSNGITGGPAFFFTHVGGMVFGDRFVGISTIIDYVELLNAVIVTVEYRLAPENPAPAALEDSYAALLWTAAHADELGFDPTRLIVAGASAGGGLAAGLALLSRDKGFPALAGQMLLWPMLDMRNNTVSSQQVDGIGVWDHASNEMGWTALLGDRRLTGDVTVYESPSLESEPVGLPPAYLEVGSVEVFRDETVSYASALWSVGGTAELHVWPGGYHLFELLAPESALAIESRATRNAWVVRNFNV